MQKAWQWDLNGICGSKRLSQEDSVMRPASSMLLLGIKLRSTLSTVYE